MKPISSVIIGNTGSGKSTFANTLLSKNAFKESAHLKSQTTETKGEYGTFEGQQLFIIDTPGLQDSEGNDQYHLNQMTEYIRKQEHIQSFIFVFNFLNYRFDQSVIQLFQMMKQMFPNKKWYQHVAIIWSNYFDSLNEGFKQTRELKRKQTMEFIKQKIVPEITQQELNAIPQIFIDSVEARKENSDGRDMIRYLIAWIGQLEPLNKSLGNIQDVKKNVIKEEIQTEKRVVSDITDYNLRTITTAKFQRTKKTMYDGRILYTDWKEVSGTRISVKKVLLVPPPKLETETREIEKVLGERKRYDGHKRGSIMQKKSKKKQQRTRKVYPNGKVEYTPWENISENTVEVEIGKFNDNVNIDEGGSGGSGVAGLTLGLGVLSMLGRRIRGGRRGGGCSPFNIGFSFKF